MDYAFSASKLAFFPFSLKSDYESAGTWPVDGVTVSEDVRNEFYGVPPTGKMKGADNKGYPAWIEVPPLTKAELIGQAEIEKEYLISEANAFMNGKQWPGKAAIGRLKGDDLTQYNLWLDYLDALEAIDTSSAPVAKWPQKPTL